MVLLLVCVCGGAGGVDCVVSEMLMFLHAASRDIAGWVCQKNKKQKNQEPRELLPYYKFVDVFTAAVELLYYGIIIR